MKYRTLVLGLAALILGVSPVGAQQAGRGGPPRRAPRREYRRRPRRLNLTQPTESRPANRDSFRNVVFVTGATRRAGNPDLILHAPFWSLATYGGTK